MRSFWLCSSIVEEGLSYRFHASWPFVLQILGCFYRTAGKQAHPIMLKVIFNTCCCLPVQRSVLAEGFPWISCVLHSPCSLWPTCVLPLISPSAARWTWLWEQPSKAWDLKSCWVLCLSTSPALSECTWRWHKRCWWTQWSNWPRFLFLKWWLGVPTQLANSGHTGSC